MNNHDEVYIDLTDLIGCLLKKWWMIILSGALCAVMGYMLSMFVIFPKYEASTRMYVLSRSSGEAVSYSDYQISDRILADYKVLITGQNVTKCVIEELELNLTVKELEEMIAVTAPNDTRVVQITVYNSDPRLAADIANCVREVASEQIQEIMDVESVNLVYEADVPEEPISPNVLHWTIGAFALGVILSAVALTVRNLMDDSIRTEEDVERYLGLSVLGVIPQSNELRSIADESFGAFAEDRKKKGRKQRRGTEIWKR